jgi:chromosomal replication initiation ATPase DnaA
VTYQDAVSMMPQSDRVRAEVSVIGALLVKKGFCTEGEFHQRVIGWVQNEYGMNSVNHRDWIFSRVAREFDMTTADARQKCKAAKFVFPRAVTAYLLRALTDLSLPQIGAFLNRHHTTVIYLIARIRAQRETDTVLDALLRDISNEFADRKQ